MRVRLPSPARPSSSFVVVVRRRRPHLTHVSFAGPQPPGGHEGPAPPGAGRGRRRRRGGRRRRGVSSAPTPSAMTTPAGTRPSPTRAPTPSPQGRHPTLARVSPTYRNRAVARVPELDTFSALGAEDRWITSSPYPVHDDRRGDAHGHADHSEADGHGIGQGAHCLGVQVCAEWLAASSGRHGEASRRGAVRRCCVNWLRGTLPTTAMRTGSASGSQRSDQVDAPIARVSRTIWASKSSSRASSVIQSRWSKFSRQAKP